MCIHSFGWPIIIQQPWPPQLTGSKAQGYQAPPAYKTRAGASWCPLQEYSGTFSRWVKTLSTSEANTNLKKNLNLVKRHTLSSVHPDPTLCDILRTQFLDKKVKLNKKMDEHLAHLYTLTVPDRYLLEMLSLRQDQEPPEPRDLWEAALHLQVSGILPELPSIPSIPVSLDHPESSFSSFFQICWVWVLLHTGILGLSPALAFQVLGLQICTTTEP